MATYLVDTNIISYANNQHSLWQTYEPLVRNHPLLLAAQTVAELRFGAKLNNWGERRQQRLEMLMAKYSVVYPNDNICSAWAEVSAQGRKRGHPVSAEDAWIAATALAFAVPLVTHNRKDFDFINSLEIISEQA